VCLSPSQKFDLRVLSLKSLLMSLSKWLSFFLTASYLSGGSQHRSTDLLGPCVFISIESAEGGAHRLHVLFFLQPGRGKLEAIGYCTRYTEIR